MLVRTYRFVLLIGMKVCEEVKFLSKEAAWKGVCTFGALKKEN
jgi:hypothetical protein